MKKLIVIALAMVLLLVSSAALGACGAGISQEDYDAVVAERDAAEVQVASLQVAANEAQDVITVLQLTAKYLDVEVALADGYVRAEPCISGPLGGIGIHYVNFGFAEAPLNLTTPERLLYLPTDDGMKLLGIEYFQRYLGPEAPPPILFGQPLNIKDVEHRLSDNPGYSGPDHYDLHVWLWEENPRGMFADYNPNVRCPE